MQELGAKKPSTAVAEAQEKEGAIRTAALAAETTNLVVLVSRSHRQYRPRKQEAQ